MNQRTKIRVKTTAGVTESAEAGDLVGQGTAGAGLVSQLNLDRGLHQYFSGSQDEMYYGKVRIEYTAYQDDVGKPSQGVQEAQNHMLKLAYMVEEKGLEAHPDKTAYIIMKGNKKNVVMMEKELKNNPLRFGQYFTMTRRKEDKYLGQYLHEDGTAASVASTVASRSGRFKGASFEIRAVIEEFSMAAMAGMMAAKVLLERALLPSLFSGACNWIGMRKATEDQCDDLIYLYWRVMFKVPDGTPKIALIAETATLRTKWRVWEAKVMLVKRLQSQEITSLARMIYEEQLRLGWPGLAEEVKKICLEIGLPDVNQVMVKKEKVKEMIYYHHYKDMKDQLYKSSKLDRIKHEDFRKEQSYMEDRSIDRCRTKFRIRTEMMKTFKDNYRSKYRERGRGEEEDDPGLQCKDCSEPHSPDSQSHCLRCPAWENMRTGLDLEDIEDLVTYFQRVLAGRDENVRRRKKE